MLTLFRDVGVFENEGEFMEHCIAADVVMKFMKKEEKACGVEWRFQRCYVSWADFKFITVFTTQTREGLTGLLSIQADRLPNGNWDVYEVRKELPTLPMTA